MLTNFTAYQAHLTDVGGGEHPSPIAHSFQHRIHFTCMAIDRQWQDAPTRPLLSFGCWDLIWKL